MECGNEQALRALQLRFIGRIIAGFTHEVKNHIAIIKESAGLMGDLIRIENSSMNAGPQYLEIIGSIEERIEKTLDIFRSLNRFAHRMDAPVSPFSLNESLEELIALLDRYARQKKIVLEKNFQGDLPPIINNPSLFQFLIFCLLDELFTRLGKTATVTLATSLSNNSVTVKILVEGTFSEETAEDKPCTPDLYEYISAQLSGTILKDKELTTVTLPLSMAS